jgi:hypothetical protein
LDWRTDAVDRLARRGTPRYRAAFHADRPVSEREARERPANRSLALDAAGCHRLPMRLYLLGTLLLFAGCGGRINPPDYPDRVDRVDEKGNILFERGRDERTHATIAGKVDRVFDAVAGAYTELGIQPTLVDRAEHRYGNVGFSVPNSFAGGRVEQYFDCGSDITGALAGRGRLVAAVVTTLTVQDSVTTLASTQVTGTLRRADGTSTGPVTCASTGAFEERLRTVVERRMK